MKNTINPGRPAWDDNGLFYVINSGIGYPFHALRARWAAVCTWIILFLFAFSKLDKTSN